jgi:hypothetical protein
MYPDAQPMLSNDHAVQPRSRQGDRRERRKGGVGNELLGCALNRAGFVGCNGLLGSYGAAAACTDVEGAANSRCTTGLRRRVDVPCPRPREGSLTSLRGCGRERAGPPHHRRTQASTRRPPAPGAVPPESRSAPDRARHSKSRTAPDHRAPSSSSRSAEAPKLPNDTAVQRRAREGAQRPTRPSVCNGRLGSVSLSSVIAGHFSRRPEAIDFFRPLRRFCQQQGLELRGGGRGVQVFVLQSLE